MFTLFYVMLLDAALSVALPTLTGPPDEGPPTVSDPHTQYWLQAELSKDCKAAIRFMHALYMYNYNYLYVQ